ncbi:MAG: hypothetical protein GVY24_04940 [Planctomycetes bacterium]|jgi:hypothetical protein|nr:hypothetical protein [Planctomycetota bacterium]
MKIFRAESWYPELRGLSKPEKNEALERANLRVSKSWWRQPRFIVLLIFPVGALGSRLLYPESWPSAFVIHSPYWYPAWMILWGFVAVWAKKSLVRTALRVWINHNLDGGDVRFCANCGYNLRGCPSDNCSECGEVIPYKSKEWIKRQRLKER